MKTHVLIVDDELSIIKLLKANLEFEGYKVSVAMNGVDALTMFEVDPPQLVVLDINMPKIDGFEICRRIREWSTVPIIMLSARGNENDKVRCLDLGADDYITKPFGTNELLARVRAVMRRNKEPDVTATRPTFSDGNIEINFSQRRVTVADKELRLTPTEYNLLLELVLNEGKVLTYTHLLNNVWGNNYQDERDYVHVFISRLRNKIESDPANPRYILTIPGVGYQFSVIN